MRLALALAFLLSCLVAWPALGDAPAERLREATLRHPDDRDLIFALAHQLEREGRVDEAVAALETLVERWPDDASGPLRLGALLVAHGRHAEALPALDLALARGGDSGELRIFRGLALEGLGNLDEAEQEFARAEQLDPALRAESLLLRGVVHFEQGEPARGARLLDEVADADTVGDVADAARLVLASGKRETRPPLRLEAYGGMGYDSNVTLDSGSMPGMPSDRDDTAAVYGAGIDVDVLEGESFGVGFSARHHERDYLDLDRLDEGTTLAMLTGRWKRDRLALRLGALGSHVTLGDDPYLDRIQLRPDLLFAARRLGVVQLAGRVGGDFYDDDPLFPSLERDAIVFGGALSHYFPIPVREGARGSWSFDYERVETDAERDALGFEGDYDGHRYGGRVDARLPLLWGVTSDLHVGLAGESYDHDNLVDFLAQLDATGTAHARRRRDVVLDTGVGLTRALHEHLDLELRWRFQDRSSNTHVFSYSRHVLGATIRVRSF